MEKAKILCVVPTWNESEKIFDVIKAVPKEYVDFTVVVDDCSIDDTAAQAKNAGAYVIRHQENKGVGAAIRSGIDYAIKNGFDIVVVISGGGKTPPKQIPKLLSPILNDNVDFVQGSRYLDGGELLNAPFHRRIGTVIYTLLFSLFCGVKISDASSGFRAFKTSIFKDKKINLWQEWLNRYELEPYFLFKATKLKYKVMEIPVTILYPKKAKSAAYTKMRMVIDWWKIFRPVVFLFFGIKT